MQTKIYKLRIGLLLLLKKIYENKVVNYILPVKTLTFLKLAQK
jgi:hypothetical protein